MNCAKRALNVAADVRISDECVTVASEFYTFWMICVGDRGLLSRLSRIRRIWLCVAGLAWVFGGAALWAQGAPVTTDEPIPTLHVYTNLLQIPTLVLGAKRERLKKPIAESRFSVSIDDGPWFRATHVRPEGDDPISLSILLDLGGGAVDLMPKIDDAIASLAPLSLHAGDRVSVYGLDCDLVGSVNDFSADSARLKAGVDAALLPWVTRTHARPKGRCKQSIHLWDALTYVATKLSKRPGRRVILVVSDGHDEGSRYTWNELRLYAESAGVAVFGLSYRPDYADDIRRTSQQWSYENPFHSLCELSGGEVLGSSVRSLAETLENFTTTLRERYIVEFPRPSNGTAGAHGMEVRIAKAGDYFVRPAGISVPVADAAVLTDPTTVSAGPKEAPVEGNRRIMTKPQ